MLRTNLPNEGKILPQAIDIEKTLLGTCIMFPDSIYEINLKPEMFYKEAHAIIYEQILNLSRQGSFDLSILTTSLRDSNKLDIVGGPLYVTQLLNDIYTDTIVKQHAAIIKQKFLSRKLIEMSYKILDKAFIDDVKDVLEYAENSLFSLNDFSHSQEPQHINNLIDVIISDIEKIQSGEKSVIGVPSGFSSIDRITGGWQNGNLIIIAGRPSQGKTAIALNLALNPALKNYPVAFFSLEMSNDQLITRIIGNFTDYSSIDIKNGDVNIKTIYSTKKQLNKLPLFIDDTSGLTLFELRSKVKKLIIKHGIKLAIVDYLQLMNSDAQSREQEVSKISRGLKGMAKEFNIPIIALSQLNRAVEERADKRPRLSDIRESGQIEADADIVCFIYRPAYYGIERIKIDGNEIDTESIMIIDGAKNRHGALFTRALYHNETMTNITESKMDNLTEIKFEETQDLPY